RELFDGLMADKPQRPTYRGYLGITLTKSGRLLRRDEPEWPRARRLLEGAIEHLTESLHHPLKDPDFFRRSLREAYLHLAENCLQWGDRAAAARAAAELPQVFPGSAEDGYQAARLLARCVSVAKKDPRLPSAKRHELEQAYGDQAMKHLRQALDNGYPDAR